MNAGRGREGRRKNIIFSLSQLISPSDALNFTDEIYGSWNKSCPLGIIRRAFPWVLSEANEKPTDTWRVPRLHSFQERFESFGEFGVLGFFLVGWL